MSNPQDVVDARPSKAFFIDMLTRDIGLKTSILDLCDNAIDQAVRQDQVDVMELLLLTNTTGAARQFNGRKISVNFSERAFHIQDSCGGIALEDAKRRVFLFGDPDPSHHAPAGLSVYGIGMKRALFKIGNDIRIRSATPTDWFQLAINVDLWKSQGPQDWEFHFNRAGASVPPPDDHVQPGHTEIDVTALRRTVGPRFTQPAFARQLRQRMAYSYALFLMSGLELEVAGQMVSSSLPEIGVSDMLNASRRQFSRGPVEVVVIAGITPRVSTLSGGWYIFCNGRMIIEHDTTQLTGWGGDPLPRWHSKYQHFIGYVYLRGPVQSLPWTTTKDSLVFDSDIYQHTLNEMVVQARPIIDFLDTTFPGDLLPETSAGRAALEASPIRVSELPREEVSFSPPPENENDAIEIAYKRPASELFKIRERLDEDLSAAQIGALTFDYYIRQECE